MKRKTSTGRPVSTGTLARGLDIIEFVAERGEVSITGLAEHLGLSRSAAYRIVALLCDRGYLRDKSDARVGLGMATVRVGLQALEAVDLFKLAPDHLRRLVELTEETAFLAVMQNDEMVYVLQEVGPQVVKVSSKLGSRAPLHATGLGKAYLSALPGSEADQIIERLELTRFTSTTLTSGSALKAALIEIGTRGYAVDDAEREPGVRCLAAPVAGPVGPIAAISVAGPVDRIRPREAEIAEAVRRTAREMSAALGAFPTG